MSSPDIFLSYNREDVARAKQFADGFKAEGFDVWWDAHLRSGEAYDKVTEDALKSAGAVVVLWSKRSVESRWVRAEATLADRRKTLMPAMIEQCERPIMFELTQTAELSHWHGDRKDQAWRTFVEDLHKSIGQRAASSGAELSASSPEPAAAPGKNRRKLLVGAAAAAILALLGTGHLIYGDTASVESSSVRSSDRIPVLVRAFAGSGGEDQSDAALAGGITDELIVRLRRIPQLQVGAAGNDTSPGANAFAGAYVVDGTVRSAGDQLRVTARLTNAKGEILWTDSFDRKVIQLFELQELIANSIASALSVTLDVGSDSKAFGGTNNPEAYAAYMQYRVHQYGDQAVALGYLNRANALDPEYLKAMSALAASYSPRINYASSRQEAETLLAEMDASTSRMLASNPDEWMSHTARALYLMARGDVAGGDREIALARDLDRGNDPELPAELAFFNIMFGRVADASVLVQSAQLIDPLFANDSRMIRYSLYSGKYPQSIDLFERLEEQGNASRQNHTLEVLWAYRLSGRDADAKNLEKQSDFLRSDPLSFGLEPNLPAGKSLDELRQWVSDRYGQSGQYQLGNMAQVASFRGDADLAVKLMRLATERQGGGTLGLAIWHPAFAKARKTDAFVKLVTDLGWVDFWQKSGKWPDFCKPKAGDGVACH